MRTPEGQATGGFLSGGVRSSGRRCWEQEPGSTQLSLLTFSMTDRQQYLGQRACLFHKLNSGL